MRQVEGRSHLAGSERDRSEEKPTNPKGWFQRLRSSQTGGLITHAVLRPHTWSRSRSCVHAFIHALNVNRLGATPSASMRCSSPSAISALPLNSSAVMSAVYDRASGVPNSSSSWRRNGGVSLHPQLVGCPRSDTPSCAPAPLNPNPNPNPNPVRHHCSLLPWSLPMRACPSPAARTWKMLSARRHCLPLAAAAMAARSTGRSTGRSLSRSSSYS